jgi:hypothetical protein
MALSYAFRQAMKFRTRRSRRLEVLMFFSLIVCGLSEAGRPFRWEQFGIATTPLVLAVGRIFTFWKWRRMTPVSSLDDRATLEYGVEFEQLTAAQQHEVLRRYQVGTYLLNHYPDELQTAREAEAHVRAYAAMRILLLPLVLVYWVGWLWLPQGRVRAGWTDAPTVLLWAALFVLALPQMIQMWTEPDDPGEPLLAAGKEA